MTITTVSASARSGGVINSASGGFTSDGNITILNLGFAPSMVRVINETDAIIWDKLGGEAAANCMKTDTAVALSTSSDIVINSDGTVSLSATVVGTSKAIRWYASV